MPDVIIPVKEADSVSSEVTGIAAITGNAIERVQDAATRVALQEAFKTTAALELIALAHDVFHRLTASKWPDEVLARFLSGWRATHGTSLFVSGLIIRLQREARDAGISVRPLLYESATEMGEIIAEDTGVDDTPHNELFIRFANQLVGDDSWQLSRYSMPACQDFREYVKQKRLAGPIEEAILMTAASECWNAGEYSYLNPCVQHWMKEIMAFDHDIVETAVSYISHHAGSVELGHFLHALDAWGLYCKAHNKIKDPQKAKQIFTSYCEHLQTPFRELRALLKTSAPG